MMEMRDEGIFLLKKDLEEVETKLKDSAESLPPLSREVALYMLNAGGKRIRPALVTASGRASPKWDDAIYSAASAVEFIHIASLIHDDLVDNSPRRRGRRSAPLRFGPEVALIVADSLFARALEMASEMCGKEAMTVLSKAICGMCDGEISQLSHRGNISLSLEEYLEQIQMKTGLFMSACCEVGAMMAGADAERILALRRFGEKLGIAFQATDDLLDYCGEEKWLGKPVGNDLRSRKITLPLILFLSNNNSASKGKVLKLMKKIPEERIVREILAEVSNSEVPKQSVEIIDEMIKEAKLEIENFSPSPGQKMLHFIADSIMRRAHEAMALNRGGGRTHGQGFRAIGKGSKGG